MDFFISIVLGHFVGDYLLQTERMAKVKTVKFKQGILACVIHCIIYTLSICVLSWHFSPMFMSLVFLSHYPIDRWSLGEKWLKLIKGRNIKQSFYSELSYRDIDLSFSVLVYTVVDNTIHLLLLWGIYNLLI